MAIIKNKDKRSGITYVYESKSYWDKEKKQSRSTRTLIGRLDEETGEIIPTVLIIRMIFGNMILQIMNTRCLRL